MNAILFDLDETLILDEPVSHQAFLAAASLAAPHRDDPGTLATEAGAIARRLWAEGPAYAYCQRIGHSAWEGLWAWYDRGEHPQLNTLKAWAPGYRLAVWQQALAAHGVTDAALAHAAVERFAVARRSYPLYPEVPALLQALKQRGFRLGIVTNGVADLQREKLNGCGLLPLFDASVASGEIDCGKPDPGIFRHICRELGVAEADCVMVGDNPERDVAGALAAGMKAVWVQRHSRPQDPRYPAHLACTDLSAMLSWLA